MRDEDDGECWFFNSQDGIQLLSSNFKKDLPAVCTQKEWCLWLPPGRLGQAWGIHSRRRKWGEPSFRAVCLTKCAWVQHTATRGQEEKLPLPTRSGQLSPSSKPGWRWSTRPALWARLWLAAAKPVQPVMCRNSPSASETLRLVQSWGGGLGATSLLSFWHRLWAGNLRAPCLFGIPACPLRSWSSRCKTQRCCDLYCMFPLPHAQCVEEGEGWTIQQRKIT